MPEDKVREPAHPQSPEDGEFTYDELLETIRLQRMWAFVRIPADERHEAEVHWWAHRDVSTAEKAMMLGHELGHISGKMLLGERKEEDRADTYGEVARAVLKILTTR